jgi:energy-coupling factor transporter ATP-binding protein EcfA2
MHNLRQITFKNFKAFKSYTLTLRRFNILVGPNNAGKSTIIVSLRILAAALRKATSRNSEIVSGPLGAVGGYNIEIKDISVADENIFHNYDDSEPATVEFQFSDKNSLLLYFPEIGTCRLTADANGQSNFSPSKFKTAFNFLIGFVPILGPVEQNEKLNELETARLALYNYGAARNFRNIWYHFPARFDEFRELLVRTWPGMDIEKVQIHYEPGGKPRLTMLCPEERIPRELFWAGYGFQVWCQLLTHIVQSKDKALFVIDEPDIYLHSELQRQFVSILRSLGPDILIATHSTEIISEAEPDEIVLVDKKRARAKRINDPSQLANVFRWLGSNLNPLLTQLAKTRRAVFIEGKDFQLFSKFAAKIGLDEIAARRGFAAIPIDGFNVDRIRTIKKGIEETLGQQILACAVLDRDFRPTEEIEEIRKALKNELHFLEVHEVKEVENFLLVSGALDRAASRRMQENEKRTGKSAKYAGNIAAVLNVYCSENKGSVASQFIYSRKQFIRQLNSGRHETEITTEALEIFEKEWEAPDGPLKLVSGKEGLNCVNSYLQANFAVSLTPLAIIEAMEEKEVGDGIRKLLQKIDRFSKLSI